MRTHLWGAVGEGKSLLDPISVQSTVSNLTKYARTSIIGAMNPTPKPVEWIASSLDDLKDFPE